MEDVNIGAPLLVSLDEDAGKVFITALDETLLDRTFEVFINYHVAVNSTI